MRDEFSPQSNPNTVVREVNFDPARHLELLLIADPGEAALKAYLADSRIFGYTQDGAVLGVAALFDLPDGSVELKNIAVSPRAQRHGVGSALIRSVKHCAGTRRLIVGTADVSSEALAFYEWNGFVRYGTIPDFFVDHYSQPVYDNGRLCRDMVLLEWKPDENYITL